MPFCAAADWLDLAREFRARGGAGCGSAQCAFETALVDALARRDGVPLWRFLGHGDAAGRAARPDALETDMTVTTGTAAQAAAAKSNDALRQAEAELKSPTRRPLPPATIEEIQKLKFEDIEP